jgi:hypothetical protein
MAVPVSTVPAAKAALFTAITTQVNDTSVLVVYGQPGTNRPDDIIEVGRVHRTVEQHAKVGSYQAGSLHEHYTIEVVVSSYRGNEDGQATDARAWALVANVEAAVRNDPTLANAVLEAVPSQAVGDDMWADNNAGRMFTVTVEIACLAVI